MTMRNKKESNQGAAFAVRHRANMTTTKANSQALQDLTQPRTHEKSPPVTSIADWLIDSGATAHMTHCIDDFHGALTPYESLVETANGGVIHVTQGGSVDIYISDVFKTGNAIIVQVNNVLYVPGLTRRLMSVHEWNACGVYDDDDEIYVVIDLPPCPGATEGTTEIHTAQVKQRNKQPNAPIPTEISQSLLHRRLGHRSMSTILMADEDNMWNDVNVI
jgi:hypothetical protein